MTTTTKNKSRFETVVPTLEKYPTWILIAGWLLVFFNVMGSFSFSGSIPGLLATGADQQAAIMLAARQLGQAFILGFGLLQKNVRTLQFVWAMVIIRESIDLAARLVRGKGLSLIAFVITLAIEIAAFIYLGGTASRYLGNKKA